jgi:hypothetical protein
MVFFTLVMFATGIALLAVSPGSGSTLALAHKASFIIWFVLMSVHVLAYLPAALRWVLADLRGDGPPAVTARRGIRSVLVAASIMVGAALGVAGLAWATPWVSRSVDTKIEDRR